MELLIFIAAAIFGTFVSILRSAMSEKLSAMAEWLVRRAAERLPGHQQDRYRDEWLAELEAVAKKHSQLTVFLWAARIRVRAKSTARAVGPEPVRVKATTRAIRDVGTSARKGEITGNFFMKYLISPRTPLFWMALAVVVVLIWNLSSQVWTGEPPVSFSEFIRWVDTGQVDRVELTGNEILGTASSGERFRTYAPLQYEGLANQLIERDVLVQARRAPANMWLWAFAAGGYIAFLTLLVSRRFSKKT